MVQRTRGAGIRNAVENRPLQAAKFAGISLTLVLGVLGFFRIVSAEAVVDNPLLADGQFLVLIFVPLLSLALVCIVVLETVVTGYRLVRSDESIYDQISGQPGYVLIRSSEAAVALIGLTIVLLAAPVLFADSTPAPAGVGLMLGLLAVGFAIFVVSLVRSFAELVYCGRRG